MADHAQASIRVVHVDDDQRFGDMVAKFLGNEDAQIEVITETTTEDCLDRLHELEVDCIVSDYDLPQMDGIELLRTVRETHPDLPFILFTGKGSEEVAAEAISAGVTDYLQKQSGTEQYAILANRIRNGVSRYRALRRIDLSHRAMETATEGLSLVQPDGTFSYVNPAFAQLFGYEQDALIGAEWSILYDDSEAKRLEGDILPAVRETGYWAGETVRLTNHGDHRVTDHRLAYTDPDIDVIVCTAQDITEERIASADRNTPFALLVDAMDHHAFYTLDHEGYLTRWNDGAERLLGYDADTVLGQHISVFFTDEDRRDGVPERLLDTATRDGSVTDARVQRCKDGCRFKAEVTISASYDDNGTLRGFGAIIEDATDTTTTGKQAVVNPSPNPMGET